MTYFAFLKGVNVSGHRIIKMTELKAIFEDMGFKNVRTFIQSGNVVFESTLKSASLKKKIEAGFAKALGYSVNVIIRNKDEMEKIVKEYPFTKIKGHEECRINVGFLESVPESTLINELESLSNDDEKFLVKGNNVYHLSRKNFADSLLGKNIIEKKLKVICTVRNWNTTNKIQKI
ncbi:MAG TPA: DUF1697 domain-containing protein [Ignavibacteria bacterium]|nr:DUF1697 domain-containing protein [Ignavibacteria bacterium]